MINEIKNAILKFNIKNFLNSLTKKASVKSAILTGFIIGSLTAVLYSVNFFEKIECISIDLRFQLRQNPVLSKNLVVVGLTKECIEKLGTYPIPRHNYAKVIDFIKNSGARSICFDIFFDLPSAEYEDDQKLADAFKRSDNITLPVFTPNKVNFGYNAGNFYITPFLRHNIAEFTNSARRFGHINIIPGSDGKIRHVPAVFLNQDKYIFPMALEAYLQYKNIPREEVVIGKNKLIIRDLTIPLNKESCLLVNYFNPENAIDFLHFELPGEENASGINFFYFTDILNGKISPYFFKDKLVLIGQTCHGLSNSDEYITPFDVMFGAFIQASLINSFLTGDFVKRINPSINFFIIIIFSIIASLFLSRMSLITASISSLSFMVVLFASSVIVFTKTGLLIEVVPAFLSIFLNLILHLIKRIQDTLKLVLQKEVELNIITKVGEKILDIYDISNTPSIVINNITESIPVQACMLYVRNKDDISGKMYLKSEYYSGENEFEIKKEFSEIIDFLTSEIFRTKHPILINDFDQNSEKNSAPTANNPETRIKSILVIPLIIHREIIGIIFLCNKINSRKNTADNFSNNDFVLLKSMICQSAVALENFQLYTDMHELFMSTIKSLVASIDAKDPYTAGHSERVTEIAVMIGKEMGLDPKDFDNLKISAILHDIGKIGISETILCSKTKLTDEEFKIIKSHPSKGEEILKHINEFINIIPGVKHHHERFDGRGYPSGLKGENIPLHSRIIAVADTFDAITSNRTYRQKSNIDVAIAEIQKCSGTQFDPKIVEVFMICYEKYKDIVNGPFWENSEPAISD